MKYINNLQVPGVESLLPILCLGWGKVRELSSLVRSEKLLEILDFLLLEATKTKIE